MKRILAIYLVLSMMLVLPACGKKETEEVPEETTGSSVEELEYTLADSLLGFGLQKIVDALGSESVSVGIEDHDSVEGLALVYIEVELEGDDTEDTVLSSDAVVRMAYSIVADSNSLITEAEAKAYAESLGRDFDDFVELKISDVRDMYFSPEVEVVSGELNPDELELLQEVMTKIADAYAEQAEDSSSHKADFTTTDINGEPVESLELFSGSEMTVLCIWTSWSIPSEKELVELQQMQDEFEDEGIQVVLLLWDASNADASAAKAARETMEKNNIDLPCMLFASGMTTVFNKSGYPATFLVSPDGTVITGELWGMYTVEEYLVWIEEETGIKLSVS